MNLENKFNSIKQQDILNIKNLDDLKRLIIKSEFDYFSIRGGSLKKIEKKIIPKVPTNKNV